MPRSIEISVSPKLIGDILESFKNLDGVISIAHYQGASLNPPGDVLTIQVTNDTMRPLQRIIKDMLDKSEHKGSVLTSAPSSIVSPQFQEKINRESNETNWDEMAFLLRQDTNLAPNYLLLMTLAGAVAAGGLWDNTLHFIIASMVIAPAFEPLIRIPFGIITKSHDITMRGLVSALLGYLAALVGGIIAAFLLNLMDPKSIGIFKDQTWVQFWSSISSTGVLVSGFAAAAGALVVTGQRSVLTTGVMIALALMPSITLVGIAIVIGDGSLAKAAFLRWITDVGVVIFVSSAIFMAKQLLMHRHRALT